MQLKNELIYRRTECNSPCALYFHYYMLQYVINYYFGVYYGNIKGFF